VVDDWVHCRDCCAQGFRYNEPRTTNHELLPAALYSDAVADADSVDDLIRRRERERIDRFEAAYNRIDRALGDIVDSRSPRRQTFAARVRIAANRMRRLAKHVDFLHEVGELRNALVHNRTEADVYIAVPHQETVDKLEGIERLLFAPEKVLPRFARQVITLRPDQSLADAWRLVRTDGYSRYPIYDERLGFVGLLTSNGFARWVANQARDGKLDVDARNVKLSEVLAIDHRKSHVTFVAADAAVGDVAAMFSDNRQLEAVLVTQRGRSEERPLGMICAADIVAAEP
jgi:CBS domain-containing protein